MFATHLDNLFFRHFNSFDGLWLYNAFTWLSDHKIKKIKISFYLVNDENSLLILGKGFQSRKTKIRIQKNKPSSMMVHFI